MTELILYVTAKLDFIGPVGDLHVGEREPDFSVDGPEKVERDGQLEPI
jgi:hypothetical protein